MAHENVMKFLLAARDNTAMLARYNQRSLSALLFQAKNEGFAFTAEELADVAGALEANVILAKDGDPFDATSRLWRQMWGAYHLEYLVNRVVRRHTDEELWALIARSAAGVG